ncbi:hypothetical protein [Sphingobacteruim zhuxiongii]|nr:MULTISPECIES: hypothetical protein [unclassified Sphingobacterium]
MASNLTTDNVVALQTLMSETIFTMGEQSTLPGGSIHDHPNQDIPQSAEPISAAEEFIFQGDKTTGVLFILRYPDYPYFSAEAEEAFLKTIGALQLNASNVAVVNLANKHNPNDWGRIMKFFEPKKIILLGVEPTSLKLPVIAHNSYMKGRIATVFNTFSFEEMFADVQKKKLFWGEFKTFIGS